MLCVNRVLHSFTLVVNRGIQWRTPQTIRVLNKRTKSQKGDVGRRETLGGHGRGRQDRKASTRSINESELQIVPSWTVSNVGTLIPTFLTRTGTVLSTSDESRSTMALESRFHWIGVVRRVAQNILFKRREDDGQTRVSRVTILRPVLTFVPLQYVDHCRTS